MHFGSVCVSVHPLHGIIHQTGTIYLDNDLLFDAVGTVDPLDDMVRATVLNYSISYFYFPFKHAHHKLPIEQELSTAI